MEKKKKKKRKEELEDFQPKLRKPLKTPSLRKIRTHLFILCNFVNCMGICIDASRELSVKFWGLLRSHVL